LKGSAGGPSGPGGAGQYFQANVDPHQTFRMFFV
jgi:hypothetical protein